MTCETRQVGCGEVAVVSSARQVASAGRCGRLRAPENRLVASGDRPRASGDRVSAPDNHLLVRCDRLVIPERSSRPSVRSRRPVVRVVRHDRRVISTRVAVGCPKRTVVSAARTVASPRSTVTWPAGTMSSCERAIVLSARRVAPWYQHGHLSEANDHLAAPVESSRRSAGSARCADHLKMLQLTCSEQLMNRPQRKNTREEKQFIVLGVAVLCALCVFWLVPAVWLLSSPVSSRGRPEVDPRHPQRVVRREPLLVEPHPQVLARLL